VLYPLPEVLLLVLCATLAGADDFVEIEAWGRERLDFLRRFLPFRHGIPSHDTLGDVMAALDPDLFGTCFVTLRRLLAPAPAETEPSPLLRLGRGPARGGAGRRRHRRQDLAPQPRPRQRTRAAAPGLGLGQPPALGARPAGGGRQVE
jgi:hypothetical protein